MTVVTPLFGGKRARPAVDVRWPQARTDYMDWHREGLTLGDIMLTGAGDRLWVAHLAAQHGVGRRNRPLRLDALEQCLARLADVAVEAGAGVALPRIGMGLTGGSWGDVEPLVAKLAARVPVTVYDLPKTVEETS